MWTPSRNGPGKPATSELRKATNCLMVEKVDGLKDTPCWKSKRGGVSDQTILSRGSAKLG